MGDHTDPVRFLFKEVLPLHRQQIHDLLSCESSGSSAASSASSASSSFAPLNLIATTDVLIATIDPKHCSSLIKVLSDAMPLTDSASSDASRASLSHLKRVRRREPPSGQQPPAHSQLPQSLESQSSSPTSSSTPSSSPPVAAPQPKKRRAETPSSSSSSSSSSSGSSYLVDVVLGPPAVYNALSVASVALISRFVNSDQISVASVPSHPPPTQYLHKLGNGLWPLVLQNAASDEQREEELVLSPDEWSSMESHLAYLLADVESGGGTGGAVVVDPKTGSLVSSSSSERRQATSISPSLSWSPLQTSVAFALQGVSRLERLSSAGVSLASDSVNRDAQYLCTGYDAYLLDEPDYYDAMCLLHSRVRRVVFLRENCGSGALGGAVKKGEAVHELRNANHHFRVFKAVQARDCDTKSKIQTEGGDCTEVYGRVMAAVVKAASTTASSSSS